MKPINLSWLFGMLAPLAVVNANAAQQAAAEETAVMQAIDRINQAYQHRDPKAYEASMTSDFVRVIPNGRVLGRSDWLKSVAASGAERPAARFDQVSVRVYGGAAVVTYRTTPPATANQPAPVGFLTRVMVKEGSQWKMAFAQSTEAQRPDPPTGAEPPALAAWSASTPAEREVLAAFEAIQKANRERNVPAWERLSAADHTIINRDGTRQSRAERIAELQGPVTSQVTPAAEQDVRVALKGDLAILTFRTPDARALKVLARKDGAWRQVLHQWTPIVAAR